MPSLELWGPAPHPLPLPRDEVHVWCARLEMSPEALDRLRATLAPDEHARASRFHFHRDRRQFIAARGILRALLARYLGRDPVELQFRCSPAGKPALARDGASEGLRFNVSHSHGLALYAISEGRNPGVDVERIQPRVAAEPLAERFFSAREVAALRAIPERRRTEAFFACWTRKEAYVKARGEGLAIRLDSFEVSLDAGEGTAQVSVHQAPPDTTTWSVRALAPAPGYVGAVAAEGRDWPVTLWHWET